MLFEDRRDAGRALARQLAHHRGRPEVRVLALPRGGVPVAFEVARALGAPMDVFSVRKLGLPAQPELAMGAIASGGVRVLNDELVEALHVPPHVIDRVAAAEQVELERRENLYRRGLPPLDVAGRCAILVDDGLATGATMRAAVAAVRGLGAARVVVAVPIGSRETCHEFAAVADEVVCAATPEPFRAVGQWYSDFAQTTDEEVHRLLEQSRADPGPPRAAT